MPEGADLVAFVFLALPGIVAVGLFSSLTPTREPEATVKIALVVLFSLLSYLLVGAASLLLPQIPDPSAIYAASAQLTGDGPRDFVTVINRHSIAVVLLASAVAACLACSLSLLACHEVLHRIARACGASRKLGYSSHWDAVVHTVAKRSWLSVCFTDGSQYVGAMESHSDASDERSLLLGSVRQYLQDGSSTLWDDGDFLFIPSLDEVRSIRIHPVVEAKNGKGRLQKWRRRQRREPAAIGEQAGQITRAPEDQAESSNTEPLEAVRPPT